MGGQVIQKRIRGAGAWGNLASDINVALAHNVGCKASFDKVSAVNAKQATDESRADGKEVRDERE